MKRSAALALLFALTGGVCAAACTSGGDSSTPTADAGPTPPGEDGGADADAGRSGLLGFTPSNIDDMMTELEAALSAPDLGDLDLSDCGPQVRTKTTGGEIRAGCEAPGTFYKVIDASDKYTVFVARNIRVKEGFTLKALGDTIPVLVALENIELSGGIELTAGQVGGAAAGSSKDGAGPGGGKGSNNATSGSGGGGSYCGLGGNGGAAAALAGEKYGTAELIPLLGGSTGGAALAGHGGGAIQLVAGGEIVVKADAFIDAPGTGGTQGGGGSGGAILLEAPTVKVEGALTANGGGGGSHCGEIGQNGTRTTTRALGACKAGTAPGGDGAAGADLDGTNGTINGDPPDSPGSGSGGGGAGRIRINTRSGEAEVTGVVSPGLESDCATQGVLRD